VEFESTVVLHEIARAQMLKAEANGPNVPAMSGNKVDRIHQLMGACRGICVRPASTLDSQTYIIVCNSIFLVLVDVLLGLLRPWNIDYSIWSRHICWMVRTSTESIVV
jgi:hypothetical protein